MTRRRMSVGKIVLAVVVLLVLVTVFLQREIFIITDKVSAPKMSMAALVIAIKGYQTEYFELPLMNLKSDAAVVESRGEILSILMGEQGLRNPRQMCFLELPPARGKGGGRKGADGAWELRDLWGNLYRMHFDVDGDGKIPNPARSGDTRGEESARATAELNGDVIVYSAGADGDYSTWGDNVKSWE